MRGHLEKDQQEKEKGVRELVPGMKKRKILGMQHRMALFFPRRSRPVVLLLACLAFPQRSAAQTWRAQELDTYLCSGREASSRQEFVAVFDDLVCSNDEVELILLHEGSEGLFAEEIGDPAFVGRPHWMKFFRIGVGPEDVAQETRVRDFRWTGDIDQLVDALEMR